MFVLIPIGYDDTRRFPLITAGLILLNILIFLVAWPKEVSQTKNVTLDHFEKAATDLIQIALSPMSKVDPSLKSQLRSAVEAGETTSPRVIEILKSIHTDPFALTGRPRYDWDTHFPLFTSYESSLQKNPEKSTLYRIYGFQPHRTWWPGLLTHQFLHYGWLHLLGNLLFLWVAGCVIEQKLSTGFIVIYLLAGVAAAITQFKAGVPKNEIMVGASGAISGMLGYALMVFPTEKVKLFYMLILSLSPRSGTFDCPIWICIPLWLLSQILVSLVQIPNSPVTIAYAAHFGGFGFGVVAGLISKGNGLNKLSGV